MLSMFSHHNNKVEGLFHHSEDAHCNTHEQHEPVPVVRQPDPQPGSFTRSREIPAVRTIATDADLKWVRPHGGNETFTFYMTLENGLFAFLQMTHSAMGLSPDVMLTCRVYHPDDTKEGITSHHGSSSMKLSDDDLSASCGEMSIKYSHTTKGYHIHYLNHETMFDIEFIPTDDAFKIGDGKAFFGKDQHDGYVQAVFMPKATVTGTMTVAGKSSECKGEGLFHHAIQVKPQDAARWNFINFQNEKDALMLYEFELPKACESGPVLTSQGCIVRNGKTLAVTTDNRAVHVQHAIDPTSQYQIPTQMFMTWHGKTLEDELDVKVEISTMLDNNLDRIDVLGELPFLLRKLIQTFVTAPFIFSWYERKVIAKVTIGDEVSEMEGDVFVECSFLLHE
ncbi:putative cell survival pathways protein [Podochytrium sp. JEL0797]|nr:putative cell survival pathways protein [Podochytrium sp. JEL0797]